VTRLDSGDGEPFRKCPLLTAASQYIEPIRGFISNSPKLYLQNMDASHA
jgi:hypothetical protein